MLVVCCFGFCGAGYASVPYDMLVAVGKGFLCLQITKIINVYILVMCLSRFQIQPLLGEWIVL